ncbi:MAG: FliM/FliN family flagellar motor switch protein [Longimicrobiales bacterium]
MSTSESLSQNEIDLLFSGGSGHDAQPSRDVAHDVQVYDFRRPARISKDRKRSLMAMYGLLSKSVEGWLTGRVRDPIEFELQSVEQLSFGEFMLALPSPCASYIVDVNETGHQGVIDFGHEFAYFIIDRLLGGAGRHVVPARPLTPLERMVVRIVADRLAFQLTEVWKDHVKLDLDVTGYESIPEMLQVANREDPVLVANIGVTIGDMHSLLLLCLPFASLEKFFTGGANRRQQLAQGTTEERQHDRDTIEDTLYTSRVTVGARLPPFRVTMQELAALKPGSVLETGLSPRSPLELFVAGQRRFTASAGRVGQNMAVRIQDLSEPEPTQIIEAGRETAAIGP